MQDEDTDTEQGLVSETTILKHNERKVLATAKLAKLRAQRRAERLPLLNLKYKMEI